MRSVGVDVGGLLHVDADERAERARVGDDALDVRCRFLLGEGEPEVRQLERDVRAQLVRGEPVEDPLVLRGDRGCSCGSGIASPSRVVFAYSPASFKRRRTATHSSSVSPATKRPAPSRMP